jgi:zinc transporter ZupT
MAFGDVLMLGILTALSSFLVGSIPFLLPASKNRRWFVTMGVGVLLGTAFVVILPEGIHTMYQPPRAPRATAAPTTDAVVTPTDAPTTLQADSTSIGWTNPLAAVADVLPAVGAPSDADWKTPLDRFKHEQQPAAIHPTPLKPESQIPTRKLAQDEGADARRRLLETGAHEHEHEHEHDHAAHSGEAHSHAPAAPAKSNTHSRFVDVPAEEPAEQPAAALHDHAHEHEEHAEPEPTADSSAQDIFCFSETHGSKLMGMSLALGFVVMILVDRCTGRAGAGVNSNNGPAINDVESIPLMPVPSATSRGSSIELKSRQTSLGTSSNSGSTLGVQPTMMGTNLSSPELRPLAAVLSTTTPNSVRASSTGSVHATPSSTTSTASHMLNFPTSAFAVSPSASDPTVMLGPLAHAIIEGCCLGAWAVGVTTPLEITPSLLTALLLHKAPAAFGVACFLVYQGRSVQAVRKQLLLYSLAAPVSSLLFYSLLGGRTDLIASGDGSLRGLAMLFAGGCFLFTIAVHILPEIQSHHGGGHHHSSSGSNAPGKEHSDEDVGTGMEAAGMQEEGRGHGPQSLMPSPQGVGSRTGSPNPRPSAHFALDDSGDGAGNEPPPDGTIPWRYVWALIVGLLVPMACSYIQERKELIGT